MSTTSPDASSSPSGPPTGSYKKSSGRVVKSASVGAPISSASSHASGRFKSHMVQVPPPATVPNILSQPDAWDIQLARKEAAARIAEVFGHQSQTDHAFPDPRIVMHCLVRSHFQIESPLVFVMVEINPATAKPNHAGLYHAWKPEITVDGTFQAKEAFYLNDKIAGWADLDGWLSHTYGLLFAGCQPLGPKNYTDSRGRTWLYGCTVKNSKIKSKAHIGSLFSVYYERQSPAGNAKWSISAPHAPDGPWDWLIWPYLPDHIDSPQPKAGQAATAEEAIVSLVSAATG